MEGFAEKVTKNLPFGSKDYYTNPKIFFLSMGGRYDIIQLIPCYVMGGVPPFVVQDAQSKIFGSVQNDNGYSRQNSADHKWGVVVSVFAHS